MTQDELIDMARKSGFVDYELDDGTTNAFDVRYEAFAKLVAEKERDRMCKHCKWKNDENSTLDETNQSKVLGKG